MIKFRVVTPVRTSPPRDFNSLEEVYDWYNDDGYVFEGLDILYPDEEGWLMCVARIYPLDLEALERGGETFKHEL